MNIVERIFRDADRPAVALISEGREVTYGSLIEQADAAAVRIASSPATQVGLDCPNGVAHVILALAIVRAGKCLVPLASELSPRERERVIRETGVGAIVDGHGEIREVPVADDLGFDQKALAALNPAFIRFSSGTTGTSKGIVLSHESLSARITAANRGLGIGPADRVLWILPMAHHFAVSIMLYLLHGATTIIENSHLAEDVLAAATTHGGTVLYGAPFHHALLASEGSGRAWSELRLAVSTAATLPLATALAFDQRYGVPLAQGLGIIEVGLPLLNLQRPREKPTSVGRPLPDYAAEVRGEGELFLRGPGMFDAYLHPWRTRAEVLEDGWFHTGDLARIDEDGDIHLLGRSHSVINVAGLKCFPEEIEAVLCEMPEVRHARVIGKANARFGAVPVAEIVPRDAANPPKISALAAYCRGALARYKVPVEFKLVESVPLTPSGKIKR
ncbi:MAG: class I adenylate-forming enzyme family protein [Chthoniobacter sp.]|nr:class I adenylate-forming enzyme family protein [Chthoniobacter sp.]